MLRSPAAMFSNRRDAGQQLADAVRELHCVDPVVLALPRGGVPVGFEVATALDAPLDVLLVRKIGAPGHEEFGIGAVIDGTHPQMVLNSEAVESLGVTPAYIERERDRQLAEIERRRRLYRGNDGAVEIEDRTVIVVDDGIATGGTVLVALQALSNSSPKRKVLAVPVAPEDTLEKLSGEAEIVCLATPSPFVAVGLYYDDFTQTRDEEVMQLLEQRRATNA